MHLNLSRARWQPAKVAGTKGTWRHRSHLLLPLLILLESGDSSAVIYHETLFAPRVSKLWFISLNSFIKVVEALEYVHESPGGSRINCDMNTVGQALAQFIVLSDYRVVLNDVDDLPSGDSKTNKKSQCVVGRSNINATAGEFLLFSHPTREKLQLGTKTKANQFSQTTPSKPQSVDGRGPESCQSRSTRPSCAEC